MKAVRLWRIGGALLVGDGCANLGNGRVSLPGWRDWGETLAAFEAAGQPGVEAAILITVAEAWMYLPRSLADHTTFQLLDGEMTVSDLRPEDRTEAFMVRLESRAGAHVTWLDLTDRQDGRVTLGRGMRLPRGKCLKLASYYGE